MQDGFSTELYIEINGQDVQPGGGVRLGLQGTAAPGGDTSIQDAAGIGSMYHNITSGAIFKKIANVGSTADWSELGNVNLSNLKWRNERVIAATDDAVAPGAAIDMTAWTDNESGFGGDDMVVGDHVIVNCAAVPVLLVMTAKVSNTSVTLAAASQAIVDNNTFVVQKYLPDVGASQEAQAIITIPVAGAPCIKVSDFNWALATGISLNGLAATPGALTGTETLQVAIEKLEKGIIDSLTVLGVARNATNLGAFVAPATLFFGATLSVKQALQAVGEYMAKDQGVQVVGVTTVQTIDSIPVASARSVVWEVNYFETATPANAGAFIVHAMNNGAAVVAYSSPYAKLKTGTLARTVVVDISAGEMRLRMTAGASATITARRREVNKNVL